MGILNVTPDSFFAGSRMKNVEELMRNAEKMVREGAAILDIGAQSTRPGAQKLSTETELQRLIEPLKLIRKELPNCLISVDTYHASIAREAVECGADMINDISGGTMDEKMFETVANSRVPYVLMHIKGEPSTMHHNPIYEDVVAEVVTYFSVKINQLRALGVNDIILDPGFGFGKTVEHNLQLMNGIDRLKIFGLPVMVGISRKKTIQHILGVTTDEALNGTTVLNTIALMKGAQILRVHDVAAAIEVVKIISALNENQPSV